MKDKAHAPVEQLIAQLDEPGLTRDVGGFTLDRDKAREKMRQFQLADPHRYVLELVQAAVRMGATHVRFDIDADDMRLRFDGRPFSLEDFEHLYDALFSRMERVEGEAVRQLAIGLNAAMALNPRWIRVWSGAERRGAHLEMRPGQDDRFEPATGMADGTLIHVKGRFRPGLAVTFFQNLQGKLPEEALLRERCGFSRVPIELEGRVVSRGLELPNLVGQVTFDHPDAAGVVGWAPAQQSDALLHFVRDGVWISTHEKKGEAECLVAVLDSPRFRKDVSQLDVVKDEAYQAALARLKAATSQSVARIARELREAWEKGEKPPFPLIWGFGLCQGALRHVSSESLRSTSEGSLGYHLARVPFWTTLSGERVDSLHLLGELDRHGQVAYATRAFDEHPEDPELSPAGLTRGELVLRPEDETQAKILHKLFGDQLKKITKVLEGRVEAIQNRRLWRMRPAKPRLSAVTDADRLLATQTFEGPTARGEVGLWRDPLPTTTVFFVLEGHALCRVEVTLPIPGLLLVVEAPFSPSARFDNVQRDAAYVSALSEALEALPSLFDTLAAAAMGSAEPGDLQRTTLRAYVTALGRGDLAAQFFDALGIRGRRLPASVRKRPPAWREALQVRPDADAPPSALARLPLWPALGNRLYSLADLWEHRAAGTPLCYVSPDLPPLPGRADPVLRLTPEEVEGLSAWFGDALTDATEELEAWKAEADFLRRPAEPVTLGGRDLTEGPWRIRLQGEGLEGEVALTYVQSLGAPPPWPLRLLYQRRTLAQRDVFFDALSGAAVISSDALQPNEDWDDVVEDREYLRVLGAVHRAAFSLLGHLADHQGQILPLLQPSVKALLVRALEAALPTRSFGRALLALRRALPTEEEADRAYQDLVDLLSTGELVLVDTALTAILDAGELPTRMAVQNQLIAQELQPAKPPVLQLAVQGGQDRFLVPPKPIDPERCPFSALRWARVFLDDEGQPCSLTDALVDFQARGQVLVLNEPGDREAVPEQRIFLVEGGQEVVLRHVFGHEALVDGTAHVEAARQRRLFAAQQAVERPTLPEGAILARRVLADPQRQGEVGLLAQPMTGSYLRVFFQGRLLCQVPRFSPLGLLAAVNDDRLTPAESFTDVARDEAYEALVAACEATVPALLIELGDRFHDLAPEQRSVGLQHLLVYLARPPLRRLSRQAQEPDPVLARWLYLPAVEGPTGLWHSLGELLEAEARYGELVFLPAPGEGTLREPSRCMILGKGVLIKRLRALFGKVTSHERQWKIDQAVAALEARGAPRLEDPDRIRCLARAVVVLGRLRGTLFLPESAEEPLVVRCGAFGLQLLALPRSGLYPVAGLLLVPEEQALEGVAEEQLAAELTGLADEARGLYRTLAGRFPGYRGESELKTRARDVLRQCLQGLVGAERAGEPLAPKDKKLLNQLTYLPLLAVDGEHINLDTARKRKPSALAGQGYWEEVGSVSPAPTLDVLEEQGMAEEGPLVLDRRASADLDEVLHVPVSLPSPPMPPSAPRAPHRPPPPAEPLAPPEPEAPPEERLIEALRAELLEIAAPRSSVLRHVNLRAIQVEKRKKDVPVSSTEQGIFLHLRHPLVAAALREGPGDPLLVTYLASALYTAVNLHLEEVTDQDEAVFQSFLLLRVRRAVGATAPKAEPDPEEASPPSDPRS